MNFYILLNSYTKQATRLFSIFLKTNYFASFFREVLRRIVKNNKINRKNSSGQLKSLDTINDREKKIKKFDRAPQLARYDNRSKEN